MTKTKIQWAHEVWNPTVGCTRVSEGCRHCYAERMAVRLEAMRKPEYEGLTTSVGRWNGKVRVLPERLERPLHWKKPRRVFVDSMSDLFHESIYEFHETFLNEVFAIMAATPQHTYMILTKRPHLMQNYMVNPRRAIYVEHSLETIYGELGFCAPDFQWPLPNVWLGVSAEDQKSWDQRYPDLLQTPAALRFASLEPLLGEIDMDLGKCPECGGCGETAGHYSQEDGMDTCDACGGSGETTVMIDWVICGCESGPGHRPMDAAWARSLRNQCQQADVPFFLKQMYDRYTGELAKEPYLDNVQHLEFPT